MDMYLYITEQDRKHEIAFEVARFVSCRLERHLMDGAEVFAPFHCNERCVDQVRHSTSIKDADSCS